MSLSSHSAPGANAGFSYQFERALYWLAQSPAGFRVGIETDDDVAILSGEGPKILEQDKHSIRKDGEPFGNRSKDLWNTLAIWTKALDSAEVSAEMARFLMVTNKTLPDCIAHQIGRAQSDADVDSCITALKEAAKKPPKSIAALVEQVLGPESRSSLRQLILRCECIDGAQSSGGDGLRSKTIACLQLPGWCVPQASSVVDELLGWMHRTSLDSWRKNQPSWIERDHFVNQLHAIIDHRRREISRERAEHLIEVKEDEIGESRGRPFVKQLHLVTDDDTIVDGAIREFIRCNIEKSRLSTEGDITDDDWKAFETALLTRWDKIRGRVSRMRKDGKEEDIGFEIFTETTEDYREKLAGSDTEQVYLTSGTYHRLADIIRIGWHPRFKDLMRVLKKKP